jgi:RNA polymerase sigma factor (TIGR02999 family)
MSRDAPPLRLMSVSASRFWSAMAVVCLKPSTIFTADSFEKCRRPAAASRRSFCPRRAAGLGSALSKPESDAGCRSGAWLEVRQHQHAQIPIVGRDCDRPDYLDANVADTLQATALANEACVRLVDVNRVEWQDRAHFFAMASRMMRRILVDSARSRRAGKRGGDAQQVTLDSAIEQGIAADQDVTVLDDALTALELVDPRKCQVVELRFFGGLSVDETAEVLKVSPATVARDWTFARTWLKRELRARTSGSRRDRRPRSSR